MSKNQSLALVENSIKEYGELIKLESGLIKEIVKIELEHYKNEIVSLNESQLKKFYSDRKKEIYNRMLRIKFNNKVINDQ